jgi:hypothetical protein
MGLLGAIARQMGPRYSQYSHSEKMGESGCTVEILALPRLQGTVQSVHLVQSVLYCRGSTAVSIYAHCALAPIRAPPPFWLYRLYRAIF